MKRQKAKIRTGDKVILLVGKDKGRTGVVKKLLPPKLARNKKLTSFRVIVEGLNLVKKHTKATQTSEGGIISKEASIDISNVAICNPNGRADKIGFTMVDGKKVRIYKSTGDKIENNSSASGN